MKKLLTLVFSGLMISLNAMADVGQTRVGPDRSTAAEDDKYVDELSTKESAIRNDLPLEIDKTLDGQSQIYSKEDDQQRMEVIKDETDKKGRD